MYTVRYGDSYLHDPYDDDAKVSNLTVNSVLNGSCTCTFNITPTNPLYGTLEIRSMTNAIYVCEDDTVLFEGYITSLDTSYDLICTVNCNSGLGYLSDTIIRPYATYKSDEDPTGLNYIDGNPNTLFEWYISQHNAHAQAGKQFSVGINQAISVCNRNYIYQSNTGYSETASEINTVFIDTYGGYLFSRYENGIRIIDYFSDCVDVNAQVIDFGENLTNFSKSDTETDVYTCLIPIGYTPEDETDDDGNVIKSYPPLSLADMADGYTAYSGFYVEGDRVYYVPAVETYGIIEQYQSYSDDEDVETLLYHAVADLLNSFSPSITIEAKAVDLSLYKTGYKPLLPGQLVRIRSAPHNIDSYMLLSEMDLDLQNPGNTTYTFGMTYGTLTGLQNKKITELNSSLNRQLDSVSALDKTTKDAAKAAQNAKTLAKEAKDAADEAIVSSIEQFYNSTSPTELAGGTWSQNRTWVDGKYTWRRTLVSYANGSTTYSPDENGICISGNTGETGAQGEKGDKGDQGETGAQGEKGDDGNGIASTNISYQASSSDTVVPTSTWSSTVVETSETEPYLWTKTSLIYDNAVVTDSYSVSSTLKSAVSKTDFAEATTAINDKYDSLNTTVESHTSIIGDTTTISGTISGSIVQLTNEYSSIDQKADSIEQTVTQIQNGILIQDTRTTNAPPSWYISNYPGKIVNEYKNSDVIELNTGIGTVTCILTTQTPDQSIVSSSLPRQTAKIESTGREFWRAAESTSAWSSWIDTYGEIIINGYNYSNLESKVKQNATSISECFTKTDAQVLSSQIDSNTENIEGISNTVDTITASITRNMDSEGNPQLELKTTANALSVLLTNSQLTFKDSGTAVAYISNQKLYIQNAEILDQLNLGTYAWKVRSNGNLSLVYSG